MPVPQLCMHVTAQGTVCTSALQSKSLASEIQEKCRTGGPKSHSYFPRTASESQSHIIRYYFDAMYVVAEIEGGCKLQLATSKRAIAVALFALNTFRKNDKCLHFFR